MSANRSSPFSPRTMLALVLFGALAFVGVLWSIGSGLDGDGDMASGAHVGGKGLIGYAAFADYLDRRGYAVSRVQSLPALKKPGLLVLTPMASADGKKLNDIVNQHRHIGPTMVIMPKWQALPAKALRIKAKPGWVVLGDVELPVWKGFHDDIAVDLKPLSGGESHWQSADASGRLPVPANVISAKGASLIPLVTAGGDGRIVAGYINDGGQYDALEELATGVVPTVDEDAQDDGLYPLILVFEPDLLNNYGFGDAANATLGETLVRAALDGESGDGNKGEVAFDLTQNGFVRSQNLLTLAFTPPFLAATLCLLLAALVTGWRGFRRFGPTRLSGPAIAFGKSALVANAAALIRRARRLHLVGAPYADAARDRLARALALPQRLDGAATEAAIDRALAARAPDAQSFSATAAALRNARRPTDMLRAAQTLHSLERMLRR